MKDLPHHMKKFNRNVLRSMRRAEKEEELPDVPRTFSDGPKQKRKKAKRQMKKERKAHVSEHKTPEERNKEMKKGRVPVFSENPMPKFHPPKHQPRLS